MQNITSLVTMSNGNITYEVIDNIPGMMTMAIMANNLKEIRKRKKLSVWKLEEMTGISAQQINRLEKGERRLNTDNLKLLSMALECNPEDIISSAKKIQVVGYLKDGVFNRHKEGDMQDTIEAPPGEDADRLEAWRVEDNSAGSIAFRGWYVIAAKDRTFFESECIDKICLVKPVGGSVVLRKLKKGSTSGKYTLASYTPGEDDITDVSLEWCVKMKYSMQA